MPDHGGLREPGRAVRKPSPALSPKLRGVGRIALRARAHGDRRPSHGQVVSRGEGTEPCKLGQLI